MKFVRKHFARNSMNPDDALSYVLKVFYEFWGFCVNGGNDPKAPGLGAFAPITPFSAPAGFDSGSTILLASGSDGQTSLATQFFSSSLTASFLTTHVGKHLVTWKSGSESTDDSIYEITQFINSGVVRVNTFDGGTPLASVNNAPWFTTRTNINWRVIDFNAARNLNWVSGNFLVIQMPGASEVNAGQATPQVKIGLNMSPSSQNGLRLTLSPSGSWTGTAFTDGDEFKAETFTGFNDEWGSGATTPGYINMTGDRSFLYMLMQGKATDGTVGWFNRSGIYVEVPLRLYPQVFDPNPFCAFIMGDGFLTTGVQGTTKSTITGINSFHMMQHNGRLARWLTMLKCYSGLQWDLPFNTYMGDVDSGQLGTGYNRANNKFWLSSAVLAQINAGQFCLSRVKIRNLAFGPDIFPNGTIIGSGSGAWIKLVDHVFGPWDGARLPHPYLV